MNKNLLIVLGLMASFILGFYLNELIEEPTAVKPEIKEVSETQAAETNSDVNNNIKLGAFSISLAVADLKMSKEFYEKLGFNSMGGDMNMNYLIMKNETTLIGLFQGMFENNIITFNPGWDTNAKDIETFDDIRVIQKHLIREGIMAEAQVSGTTTGPGSIVIYDPDSNMVLIDQHR